MDIKIDRYIKTKDINAIILKRLNNTIRDKDFIYIVIRGLAINSNNRILNIVSFSFEV